MEKIDDQRERKEFERQLRGPRALDGWFESTPWWLVSAGIHAVVLLGAALIYVERLMAVEDPTIICSMKPPGPILPDLTAPPGPPGPQVGAVQQNQGPDSDEPSIFDPLARPAKHNETDNDEPWAQRKGDSNKFFGSNPGEAGGIGRQSGLVPGMHDRLGVGAKAGGGGSFGGRKGGRERLAVANEGGPSTEAGVRAALFWLARHQGDDGGWGADSFPSRCVGAKCTGPGDREYDVGVTGLSVLAFLGAGYSHVSRDEERDPVDPSRVVRYGEVVKNGVRWLLNRQDPEGCVGERGVKYMYNHAIAALALSEAYGMTAAAPLRDPAQKAIDFLVGAQNPAKGWRYSARSGDNDTSVTGWAVMALKSAELSDLRVPRSAYDGALNWLVEATDKASGYAEVGYTQARTGTVVVPGKNESFMGHPAMSAVSVMSRIFIQKKKDPALVATTLLLGDLPEWKADKIDFYYWYYGSLALFQFDGPEGPCWRKWNEPMKNAIVPHQRKSVDGCRHGSWDPEVERWGMEGGRVYAAAINALTLEVYYRYANVFGGTRK